MSEPTTQKLHDDCLCDHAIVSLGRLYGVDCGRGLVRTTSHPNCPHHGETSANYPFSKGRKS